MILVYEKQTLQIACIAESQENITVELMIQLRNLYGEEAQFEQLEIDMTVEQFRQCGFDLVKDADGVVSINIVHPVPYQIDKPTITTAETATITAPAGTIATVEETEYILEDGILEYSNANPGTHEILLTAEGYNPITVFVEVVEVEN